MERLAETIGQTAPWKGGRSWNADKEAPEKKNHPEVMLCTWKLVWRGAENLEL